MALHEGDIVEISNVGHAFDIEMRNVWQYQIASTIPNLSAPELGESWWNHVKTALRGVVTSPYSAMFQSVLVRELNDVTGDYGEFAVPPGEQAGTRSPGAASETLPPFAAASLRLTVATRTTRPGHKRFPGMVEGDQTGGTVVAAVTTALNALGAVVSNTMVLGAPALTVTLTPIVVKKDAAGFVVASQPIVGYLASPYVTTQNSRKFGHGS